MKSPLEVGGILGPPFAIVTVEEPGGTLIDNHGRTAGLDRLVANVPDVLTVYWHAANHCLHARLIPVRRADAMWVMIQNIVSAHPHGQMLFVEENGETFFMNRNTILIPTLSKWRALLENEWASHWIQYEDGAYAAAG